jgi:hypothetical protein
MTKAKWGDCLREGTIRREGSKGKMVKGLEYYPEQESLKELMRKQVGLSSVF